MVLAGVNLPNIYKYKRTLSKDDKIF